MAADEKPLAVPAQRQVAEEPANAGDGLPSAFPAQVGPVQEVTPGRVQLGGREPGALAVIAFAQPPVVQDLEPRLAEGDGCRLGGASQVGAEHGGDPVSDAPLPKLTRLVPGPVLTAGRAAIRWRVLPRCPRSWNGSPR